jgi:hypothetical protein
MNEQAPSKEKVCEHDFVCIGCGSSLDDLQQPLGWMTEGGQMFIEHRLKLERPEDFVRFTIPVPRVPTAANEEPSAHEPPAVRRWDIRPAFGDGVDFLVDPAGEWVKWEDVATHLRPAPPPEDERTLRRLLAFSYSSGHLYGDDGELQDNRLPHPIDYVRDSVAEIERKINARGMDRLLS